MKVTLTSMAGNTRNINLSTKQEVYDFIELFKSTLLPTQRMKVTCDLLGIDGYLQGENKIQRVLLAIILRVPVQLTQWVLLHREIVVVCSLFIFIYFLQSMYHTSEQNIQIFAILVFTKFFRFGV